MLAVPTPWACPAAPRSVSYALHLGHLKTESDNVRAGGKKGERTFQMQLVAPG